MLKRSLPLITSLLLLGMTGCGLAGWQGEAPETKDPVTVRGVMQTETAPEQGEFWVIKDDTVSYVPENQNLPPAVRRDSLSVQATGIIKGTPDYFPEGRFFEIRTITPLE